MEWIIKLFTQAEWSSIFMLLFLTFSSTELTKRLQRILYKRYKNSEIWFSAFISGLIWSYIIWPESAPNAEWYVAGMIVGPVTAALHRMAIGWIKYRYPEAHAAITGDHRKKTRRKR